MLSWGENPDAKKNKGKRRKGKQPPPSSYLDVLKGENLPLFAALLLVVGFVTYHGGPRGAMEASRRYAAKIDPRRKRGGGKEKESKGEQERDGGKGNEPDKGWEGEKEFDLTEDYDWILDRFTGHLNPILFIRGNGSVSRDLTSFVTKLKGRYKIGDQKNEQQVIELIRRLMQKGYEMKKNATKMDKQQIFYFNAQMGTAFEIIPGLMLSDQIVKYSNDEDPIFKIFTELYYKLNSPWDFTYVIFTGFFAYLEGLESVIPKQRMGFTDFLYKALTFQYVHFSDTLDTKSGDEIEKIRNFWGSEKPPSGNWAMVSDEISRIYSNRFIDGQEVVRLNKNGVLSNDTLDTPNRVFFSFGDSGVYTSISTKLWGKIEEDRSLKDKKND